MIDLANLVLKKYGYTNYKLYPAQKGYRNSSFLVVLSDKSKINLIIYKKEVDILSKIKAANYMGSILKEVLKTRYALKPIMRIDENFFACVYNYLDGTTIGWDSYTKKHLVVLAQALNTLHNESFKNVSSKDALKLAYEAVNLSKYIKYVYTYFENKDVNSAVKSKLKIDINFLKYVKNAPNLVSVVDKLNPPTLLHMDFVRSNILFDTSGNPKITGIIDFEKASRGSFIFDVARSLAFLIVDCKYKTEVEVRKAFLKSGYLKNGIYKPTSFKYLNDLVCLYLIYDFYKFLKHNPYEFLLQNEHYNKTVELLTKIKLVTPL